MNQNNTTRQRCCSRQSRSSHRACSSLFRVHDNKGGGSPHAAERNLTQRMQFRACGYARYFKLAAQISKGGGQVFRNKLIFNPHTRSFNRCLLLKSRMIKLCWYAHFKSKCSQFRNVQIRVGGLVPLETLIVQGSLFSTIPLKKKWPFCFLRRMSSWLTARCESNKDRRNRYCNALPPSMAAEDHSWEQALLAGKS